MSAVLNTNVASLWASKNLLGAQNTLASSVERLSSGLRINRARDDAAGLGVANSLTAQINGANQGVRNLNDAISMVQTAEGAIAAASQMGQRILMLATQGANGTLGPDERAAIKTEMLQLISSIDSIGGRTEFSGNPLLSFAKNASVNNELYSMQISNTSSDKVAMHSDGFLSIGSVGGSVVASPNVLKFEATDVGVTADLAVTGGTVTYEQGTATTKEISTVTFGNLAVNGTAVFDGRTLTARTALTGAQVAAAFADPSTLTNAQGSLTGALATTTVIGFEHNTASGTGQATNLLAKINDVDPTASAATATAKFQLVQTAAQQYVVDLGTQRSLLGAYQNQMEYTLTNITELSSNLQSARSRVIDTDYASETANLTKGQILQQAATAMLAQANQMPNVILTLLK
jgi:flagellin